MSIRDEAALAAADETASLQRVVAQQTAELQALRAATERSAVEATIAGVIDASGMDLHPGAREQITALLRTEIALVNHGGQTVPVGPALRPAAVHISERLQSPEFSHFKRGGAPTSPAATPFGQVPAAPRSFTEAMIADAAATRAAAPQGDPRMNMSMPMALTAKRR